MNTTLLPSPDAPPSQDGQGEFAPTLAGERNQRRELGEALLHVSAMIEASRTQAVEVATMCLHCRKLPASKVEGPDGFTLCSDCYFATGIDDSNFMQIPPRSAQDRMIAVLMAENERLRRALYACERILSGGES